MIVTGHMNSFLHFFLQFFKFSFKAWLHWISGYKNVWMFPDLHSFIENRGAYQVKQWAKYCHLQLNDSNWVAIIQNFTTWWTHGYIAWWAFSTKLTRRSRDGFFFPRVLWSTHTCSLPHLKTTRVWEDFFFLSGSFSLAHELWALVHFR
jgi:hypothetical protein